MPDARKADRLITTLLRHDITVNQLTAPITVEVHEYATGIRQKKTFPKGTYVIPFVQRNYRLVKNLLAPRIPLPEPFVRQELQKMARNLRLRNKHLQIG